MAEEEKASIGLGRMLPIAPVGIGPVADSSYLVAASAALPKLLPKLPVEAQDKLPGR
jgi:hypothetical protein